MQRNGKLSSINQRAGGGGGGGKQQKLPGNVTTCWIYQKKLQNNLYKYVHKTKGSHSFKIKERYNENVATKTKKEIEIISSAKRSQTVI